MQIARKLFHASGVLIVLVYQYAGFERPLMAGSLWGIVVGSALIDFFRHRIPAVQAVFRRIFGYLMDEKDDRGLNTSTLYFAGCALTVTAFEQPAACAGILALAIGDPVASIVGRAIRSPRWRSSSVAGSLACLVAATLACRVYFDWPPSLAAGAAATAAEALSGSKLDNLTIPVAAALVLALL